MQTLSQLERYFITQLAANYAAENVKYGDVVLDATMGNGKDTLLLSKLAGETGKTYAFDVQKLALDNTSKLIKDNCAKATLILDSHDKIDEYIDEELSFAMYNLGYLPGGDKAITTKKDISLLSIRKCMKMIKVGGMITVCLYPGHEKGLEEALGIESYLSGKSPKDYFVLKTGNINIEKGPFLIMIKKLR